jgi:hypothetical protein
MTEYITDQEGTKFQIVRWVEQLDRFWSRWLWTVE